MRTILLVTYDISPYRGSEASVSWNYVYNMQRTNKLIVLYGKGKEEIDRFLQKNKLDNVHFYNVPYIEISGAFLDIRYNLNYRKWHEKVYLLSRQIIEREHVDVIHYLNPIGFKEPGFLYKIKNIPYVWGPIQGVENRPYALYPALSMKGRVNALMRRIIHNGMLKFLPRVKKALRRADIVFAATPNTVKQLKEIHHKESVYLPENGIIKMNRIIPISEPDILNLIWVGAICERKGLEILIRALGKVKHINWHLNVMGDGPLLEECRRLAIALEINDNITWYGKVQRTCVQKVFANSHLHIISSLGEGNTTVIWEAFSWAVPTMTLDHCGMSTVVCEKCGIKIPIFSYTQVINDMAMNIDLLLTHPQKIEKLSRGVIECSKKFLWSNRIELFNKIYDELIYKYAKSH